MKDLSYADLSSSILLLNLVPTGFNVQSAVGEGPAAQLLVIQNNGEKTVNLTVDNYPTDTTISIAAGDEGVVTCRYQVRTSVGIDTETRYITDDDNSNMIVAVFDSVLNVTSESEDESMRMVGANVYRTTAQSIPDNTSTAVSFSAERYDTDGFHSTTVNPSRITVPTTGYYDMWFNGNLASASPSIVQVSFLIEGSTIFALAKPAVRAATTNFLNLSRIGRYLTAGQYIEVYVLQVSGGAVNLEANSSFSPEFVIELAGT